MLIIHHLVLFGVLCSATHWLVARSEIARPLWSRARGWLDKLLRCPACSGFWLGLWWGIWLPPWKGSLLDEILVCGLLGLWITPVFEAVLLWGLERAVVEPSGNGEEGSPEDSSSSDVDTAGA